MKKKLGGKEEFSTFKVLQCNPHTRFLISDFFRWKRTFLGHFCRDELKLKSLFFPMVLSNSIICICLLRENTDHPIFLYEIYCSFCTENARKALPFFLLLMMMYWQYTYMTATTETEVIILNSHPKLDQNNKCGHTEEASSWS